MRSKNFCRIRTSFLFFRCSLLSFFSFSCQEESFGQGTWVQKASLPGLGRLTAVAFTIGNKGYLGTGDVSTSHIHVDDFWEYDPITDTWTQKANFGGGPRAYAVGFSIGVKGYLGTGADGSLTLYNDFWEYDPNTNNWTQKANVPGPPRSQAVSFSFGNYGFVATGSPSLSDLWEYDPVTNSWIQKANYFAGTRTDIDRAVFVVSNKVYMGTGGAPVSIKVNDFWEYDPANDSWSQKSNFPGVPRWGATGFSICGNGYLGLGEANTGNSTVDIWKYDPSANSWGAVSSLPGQIRGDAPSFVINNKAYIGTGFTGSVFLNDLWEFTPPKSGNLVASVNPLADTICAGQIITLVASGGNSYIWNTGNSTDSIIVSPTITTTYSVTVSTDCDLATANTTITVMHKGIASFTSEYEPCKNTCVQFTDQSINALTWQWDFGDGNNNVSENPCHSYIDTIGYSVFLIINGSTTCADTINMSVPYVTHDTVASVYIPNAFSPNGDGDNDSLKFYLLDNYCLKDFEIAVYGRWGEQVFATSKLNDSWDGTFNGKKLDSQTLTYYCKTTTATGRQAMRKGNISLVR